MDLNNKIIFCDWHDVLSHYNLPKIYLSKISNMCKENNHKFVLSHDLDDVYLDSHIVAYIGNRPHNKLLNLETLKWIHFGSVGVDKIDLKKASQKNILITNARGIFDKSVSHMAFCKIFELLNANVDMEINFNRKYWEEKSIRLNDCVINILGYGGIAKSLVELLIPVGCKINVFTKNSNNHLHSDFFSLYDYSLIKNISKDQKNSILINLLPLFDETHSFISNEIIYYFEDILAYLNLGRLDTENHNDIIDALNNNKIKKAYWDVIRDEDKVRELRNIFDDRVHFTPHISSFLYNHWNKTFELIEFNLSKFFNSEFTAMKNIIR